MLLVLIWSYKSQSNYIVVVTFLLKYESQKFKANEPHYIIMLTYTFILYKPQRSGRFSTWILPLTLSSQHLQFLTSLVSLLWLP